MDRFEQNRVEAGGIAWKGEKIVGYTDYKTTANIYTHVRDEMLKKATVNMGVREQGTRLIRWNYDYSGRFARILCVLD